MDSNSADHVAIISQVIADSGQHIAKVVGELILFLAGNVAAVCFALEETVCISKNLLVVNFRFHTLITAGF